MSTSIDTAFIKQFEAEVHMAYQRFGSKMRNTVRVKSGLNGTSTYFQKVGKGTASTKARHAEVVAMNIAHTNVECTVADYYASDYVDKLDELKINIDERMVLARSGAAALGRQTDELILTAMDTTTNTQATGSVGLTKTKIYTTFERMGDDDVPDDNQRYWVVGSEQWTELLDITEFANSQYIGGDDLPFKGGMTAKRWMGFLFYQHSGLPLSSATRKTFAYHQSGVGTAWGADVSTEINYIAEKVSNLVTSMMSMGAVLIDADGVEEVSCTEA